MPEESGLYEHWQRVKLGIIIYAKRANRGLIVFAELQNTGENNNRYMPAGAKFITEFASTKPVRVTNMRFID